jgi:hypothetical protein
MPTEADFQIKFTRWLRNCWKQGSAAFELKIIKGDSIPFSAVKTHQLAALKVVQGATFTYKIPDVGIAQKPFDAFVLHHAPGYVVIYFYTKRGEKEFYMILANEWEAESERSIRRSLTRKRAEELSTVVGYLSSNPN